MTKQTETQSINKIEIRIGSLESVFTEHKAKCNRDQCIKDHDIITKQEGKLENIENYIEEFKEFQVASRDHRQELSTNINMLTDKVTNIIKTHDTTSDMRRNIVSGIIITVLSAIIITGFTMVISNINKTNDSNLKHMQVELQEIKANQFSYKREIIINQDEIIENQAQVKKDLNTKGIKNEK